MASGFFTTIFRFLIFLVNFAFLILGGIMFVIGIQLHQDKNAEVVMQNDYTPISVIVLGALIFTIAFFGCCGAFKEDSCMLRTYAIMVSILLILQICIIVLVYKKPETMKEEFKKRLQQAVEKYYTPDNKAYKDFIDQIQNSTMCCGVESYEDYKNTIPTSCCKESDLQNNTCPESKVFKDGCYNALINTMKNNFYILKWVVIFILGFQASSIVIAFCLANNIRRAYDVV